MVAIAVAATLLGVGTAGARDGAPRATAVMVACDRIVLRERTGAEDGFRILLGAVSMPGAQHLARDVDVLRGRVWPYYRNAGLAVRAGSSAVRVSVPVGWRDRVALSWGESAAASVLEFAPCAGSAPGLWNAYSGGIHLRLRGDCVPLHVQVGGMSTTVRVGVGRACGSAG
jgi:hypothetical protein